MRELVELKELLLRDGYDPIAQLTGYLQTGDPTYLPPGQGRKIVAHLEHDKLLQTVVASFFDTY